jgi:hypothetical protein
MATLIHAVGRPEVPLYSMSDRFRTEIAYFMSIPGEGAVPKLPQGEYWVPLSESRKWLQEGVLLLVSPLDSENRTEVELREEHEAWLEWMVANNVEHIRLS